MMIHNVTEDRVRQKVREIFDEEKRTQEIGLKTSYQNELDVICYVLNRAKPEYVVSGRGLAHRQADYQNRIQQETDLETLILEGIRKISQRQRPQADSQQNPSKLPQGPFFNFPTVMGRVFHGEDFSPAADVDIYLLDSQGTIVQPIDPNWHNPFHLVSNTAGTFLFWPPPVKAEKAGEERTFSFEIRIAEEGYEEINHFFEMPLTAEDSYEENFNTTNSFKVKDLYLFQKSTDADLL